jgi:glycosyltransferase involved in cell wall biosynthesis
MPGSANADPRAMQPTLDKNNSEKTLLWILTGDEGYGVASTVCSFSVELKKRHWNVEAAVLIDGQLRPVLEDAGINVEVLDVETMPSKLNGRGFTKLNLFIQSLKSEYRAINKIGELYRNRNIEVIETTNVLLLNLVGRAAKKLNALPVWRMAAHVKHRRPPNIPRLYLQLTCSLHKILAMGNSEYTTQSLGKGPAPKITNLHGCDPERFNPDSVRSYRRDAMGIGEDELVFAIVARISKDGDKGQLRFLEGLVACERHGRKISLLLFGGPTEGALVDKIKELANPYPDISVHLLGHVEDTERYYDLIDVSVNARLSPEPFGLSVIEAMMMGVPVLAHGLGGPAETILHGQTGWIVPDMNVPTLSSQLSTIIEESNRCQDMGKTARQRALKLFRIEDEVGRWIEQTNKYY